MAIATIVKKLQAPLNKQLQKTYKMDNNLLFPTCYNFFIQKQQLGNKKNCKIKCSFY